MFKITRGEVLSTNKISSNLTYINKYPVYSSKTLNNGLLGYYSNYLFENSLTWTTDGAGAGKVRFRSGKFYPTNVCGVLLSDKYSDHSIAHILNSETFKYVSAAAIPKLMNNVMSSIKISYSPNKSERESISKLINNLDSSIALLQRKLEKMKNIKEFLLNKMFVSGQAEFPEIRFKGFTNSWVQSPIETFVSKILKSNIFINDFKKTGNYPVYSATDIFGFINDNHLKEDAILISVDGSIGNLRIVNKNSWFISTNQAIIPNKNINIIFLFNILKRINFNKITIGTTIKHLYYSEYKNILIWSPKMNEQTKISKIFTNLDSSIALFQRKLEKLENIKKTLLNKMFI
ncbi:restriction endonuclease subunit S [Mycoplasma sp. CSL7503-lung]|uniref:restriction endonuclease subunit S n=1 Tax=Mycoplasma sp. CSL7503-lung TaxID=536372 RepID=UPI0021D09485|nr:restriction endonuclease subunit S [Mycoplasma sp. CSL7503-lung]MCU4706568.1 restriction endonuclease subunit S [Mycoplasma sp. CSL7503-lung]